MLSAKRMSSSDCGSFLFTALPEHVFTLVSRSLTPKDVCSLSLCCKSLDALAISDTVWLAQCENVGVVDGLDLVEWRKGVSSYKSMCRFLCSVKPLTGIWVHQNPELGNVVYVMPGFLSVVGCRIIPQGLGPLGVDGSPLLWASIFEIICDSDSSMIFFLHGREKDSDFLYRGSVKCIEKNCTVLLLEVEPKQGSSQSERVFEKSSVVPFHNLDLGVRRKLLELATDHVRIKAPELANGLLFSPRRDDVESLRKDVLRLSERRSLLMKLYTSGEYDTSIPEANRDSFNKIEMDLNNVKENHVKLQDFLRSSNTIGMTMCAESVKLSFYRAWPYMADDQFALYKLPMPQPVVGEEYAGLWGGTFGWPSGRLNDDTFVKALFLVSLSYEQSEGRKILIATKILEGCGYALHPNGSAMFEVKIDQMSSDSFPWPVDVKCAYNGEGIGSGYGFRYPGSKPGSLYVIQDGVLAFVWKKSRAVLTLQRLDLQELLKKELDWT